jgi:hypothetical protein
MDAPAPIAYLPAEILAKIFEASISPGRDDPSERVKLMMVCQHWRSVMMEFPRLCSSLILSNVRVTATMLERSKTAPLVVEADLSSINIGCPRDDDAAVELALSHLSRTRVLHISLTDQSLRRLFPAMQQPAPLLESLRLVGGLDFTGTMTPSLGLLEGVIPRLRHFAVHNLGIPWDSPFLCNLTHLEIENCFPKPSIVEFRHILSRCPALDALILADHHNRTAISIAKSNTGRPYPPVQTVISETRG